MRRIETIWVSVLGLVLAAPVAAYEPETHAVISGAAVSASRLELDAAVLEDLGVEPTQTFRNSKGDPSSIPALVQDGARSEDDFPRPLNHFYNPLTGAGISGFSSSPDWAIDGTGDASTTKFSFQAARQYMFFALTDRVANFRSDQFGLMFRSLGHVIHHIQDMAQPQHTRLDLHCDITACKLIGRFAPSAYEKYTDTTEIRNNLNLSGYAPVYSPDDAQTIGSPRSFWHSADGKGMADYSNRGFVSAGTNFDRPGLFPLPVLDPSRTEVHDIQALCANEAALGRPCQNPNLTGTITFYSTDVEDKLRPSTNTSNPRTSSRSFFDPDLTRLGRSPVFSLNRFNFYAAHDLLMPRAVAYSAGLINYFFRGKLNFKRDEQDSTKFRILNLGPEAMNGRFALYYDAINGNRYPVTVDPADVNRDPDDSTAWRLTIAALNPAIPNSNRSDAVSFIAPANDGSETSPKVANEYMLVFNGDMGEEKVDKLNNVVGAVVAKSITTPYNGALYLLGVDASGQRVSLKSDKSGTRVLGPGDFNPLAGITIPSTSQTLTKGYVSKQVAFTEHLFGFSYDVRAATVGIHFPFFGAFATGWVKNSATGAFEAVGGVVWTAKSPDPLIGEFRFRPIVPENNPAVATLEYRRTYHDTAGNPQTSTGSIPLPLTPGDQNYLIFPQGLTFISGDGLTVSGFEKQLVVTGNPLSITQEDYDLRITLAEVPALTFVKTGERVTFSSNTTSRPQTTQVTGTVTTTVACATPPITLTRNVTTTDLLNDRILNIDEPRFIDYFNGALRSYRRVENSRALLSYRSTDATINGGGPCNWVYAQTKGEAIDKLEVDGGFVFGNGTLVNFARSDQSGFTRPLLGAFNRSWDYLYEGPSPAPPVQFTPIPTPIITNVHNIVQPIGDRVEDAVYTLQTIGAPTVVRFRTHDITNKSYVADSSPIGEVFFATWDLSVVEHEPKHGPKVVIPPNVVRLIAAVWL